MRASGTNVKLSEYEMAKVKEVYKECKSYAETGRALNISAGVVSQIVREIPGPYYERAKNARA